MYVVMDTAAGKAVGSPHWSAERDSHGGSKKEIVLWKSRAAPHDCKHCTPQSDNESGILPGFLSYRFLMPERFLDSFIDPVSAGLDPLKAITKC